MKHPIDPFLASWAAAGGPDGLDMRLRVYRSLSLMGRWDRLRLKRTLRALLVQSASLETRFESEFDAFFPEERLPSWLAARLDGASTDGPNWDLNLALESLRNAVRGPRPGAQSRTSIPAPAPSIAQDRSQPIAGSTSRDRIFSPARKEKTVERPPKKPDESARPFPIISSVFGLPIESRPAEDRKEDDRPTWGYEAATSDADKQSPERAGPVSTDQSMLPLPILDPTELDFRGEVPPIPFAHGEIRALAYRTELAVARDTRSLDTRSTVLKTARSGGLWQPVYTSTGRANRLVVGVVQDLDPISEISIESFVSGLRQHGVSVETRRTPPRGELSDPVLLVLDASRVRAGALAEWLKLPNIALVEARDPALWGDEIQNLPLGVFSLELEGLTDALAASTAQSKSAPVRVQIRGDSLDRLGEALPLAVAMAIAAPCDLSAADELRRTFTPQLPFCRLQRIAGLHGVTPDPTGWRFSSQLIEKLSRRTSPRFRARVLEWQRTRLCRLRAQPNSWAAMIRAREIELVSWQQALLAADNSPERQALVETHLSAALDRLTSHLQDVRGKRRLGERMREIVGWAPSISEESALRVRIFTLFNIRLNTWAADVSASGGSSVPSEPVEKENSPQSVPDPMVEERARITSETLPGHRAGPPTVNLAPPAPAAAKPPVPEPELPSKLTSGDTPRRRQLPTAANYVNGEVSFKIAYFGPLGSGVSTNLNYIYDRAKGSGCQRDVGFPSQDRVGQFLDLAVPSAKVRGLRCRFHLYSVPFGDMYIRTREFILGAVSGVVFVADSSLECMESNVESLRMLDSWLAKGGYSPDDVHHVFQYNKRDLPQTIAVDELRRRLNPGMAPDFEASASSGMGVFDTLKGITKLVLTSFKGYGP